MCKPAALRLQAPAQKGSGPAAPRLLQVYRLASSVPSAKPAAAGQATSTVQTVREASNILPTMPQPGLARRQELERQAKELLEKDNRWHEGEAPSNMLVATSPKHFKQLITSALAGQLVIVDYFAPHCNGCRTLYPKLKQIAANNEDCVFIKVNTDAPEMRELAMNLGVTKLPFFQLWRDSDVKAAFTANVTTVSALRAEIASHKSCTDPGCAY